VNAGNGALLLLVIVVILGVLNVNRFRIYARLSVITEWKYDAPDSANNSGLNYANCELPRFPLSPWPITLSRSALSSLFLRTWVRVMHVPRHFIPLRSLRPFATWLITSFAGGHKNIFHSVRAFALHGATKCYAISAFHALSSTWYQKLKRELGFFSVYFYCL